MKSFLVMVVLAASALSASAADLPKGLEDAINAALASKRGVTLYVNGQTIGGAITKVEPGQYVELRNQEFGKIVVRWERIDGIALP
jgi:opacity protein-like surface antigen